MGNDEGPEVRWEHRTDPQKTKTQQKEKKEPYLTVCRKSQGQSPYVGLSPSCGRKTPSTSWDEARLVTLWVRCGHRAVVFQVYPLLMNQGKKEHTGKDLT